MPKKVEQRKSAKRQLMGKTAKAQGRLFEGRLDAAFAHYKDTGFAIIEKTPEPMRPIQSLGGGKFVAFFEKKAQPDYKGVIKGGRAVMFEAKFTSTGKMEQGRVLPGQADYLDWHQALGARCYVLAGFASGAVYRFPWDAWRQMKQIFGRKYIAESDVAIIPYRVSTSRDGVLLLLD